MGKKTGSSIQYLLLTCLWLTLCALPTWATPLPESAALKGGATGLGDPIYVRGAWSLHALRLHIGDEAFFALLRQWVARYQYSNASTADFIALAEEISGQPLADIFQAWLNAEAVPPLPKEFDKMTR